MGPEVLAYPFLFIAIFFESFVLVTLLSHPAKEARKRVPAKGNDLPSVAIIVPCWNEEATISETVLSLLEMDYPRKKLEIILVDDGSTDGTAKAMSKFKHASRIKIISKKNGGKHTALNAGIEATSTELVGCLDADSFVEKGALREIVSCFERPNVAAVTSSMSIHEPKTLLQRMQYAEYIFSISMRHTLASINGLYVTPGPFSLYRRENVVALGGFRYGHQTEDMEMALRLQRAGHIIENAPRARVYTKAPATLGKLIKQRTRWTSGFLRNILFDYRSLLGNSKHGALGVLVLPLAFASIGSSVLLFCVALYMFAKHIVTAIALRIGIPLSYTFSINIGQFDWFYFPPNLFAVLGVMTLLASLSLIVIGKRVSKVPGNLFTGLVSYSIFYGFVAPLWLIRSSVDVAFRTKRGWR